MGNAQAGKIPLGLATEGDDRGIGKQAQLKLQIMASAGAIFDFADFVVYRAEACFGQPYVPQLLVKVQTWIKLDINQRAFSWNWSVMLLKQS